MQVTETTSEGLARAYSITLDAAEIDAKVDEKLEEARKNFAMKGFRKGKAPLQLMKKMFGKSVLGETVQELVDGAVGDLIADKDLKPAMQPDVKIENESFDEGDDLSVSISMELLPDIPEFDYSGIKLERLVVSVDDTAVEDALKRLAEDTKNFSAKDGATEEGDQVVMDFVGRVDGEEFEGGAAEDFPLELGSDQFIPGFEEQLVGTKAGDEKDVVVTFPEDYGAENLAGKEAVFSCTIKEVKGVAEAEIDDDLAKRYGSEDLAELRVKLKERIEGEYGEASRAHIKRKLLDALDEAMDFELPPTMLKAEADQIAHQLWHEENPEVEGHDHEKIEPNDEHKRIAGRRVRLGLLLAQIGTENDISADDNEINQAIFRQAQQYPGQEREFFEYARNNQQVLNQIQAPIFEEKVVDHLLTKISVTDRQVSKEELEKALEELEDLES